MINSKIKNIALYISIWLFLPNCKKETTQLYMSGHIYNNCYDRLPARNMAISLFRTNDGSNHGGEYVATSSTDSTGYFKIYFPSSSKFNTMKLKTGNGGELMEKIPPTGNLENVDVFATIFSNISVNLSVNNPHIIGDTLLIEKFDQNTFFKIPCPLSSTNAYIVTNYTPANPQSYEGIQDDIVYKFSLDPNNVIFKNFKIDKYCNDTVYVTIGIN